MDTLDYSGPKVNEGSKGVWLGLGEPIRELPREFRPGGALPAGMTEAHPFCPGCLVVGGPSHAEETTAAQRFARHPAFADWPLVILAEDPARVAATPASFLWAAFTRFEPAADVHAAATSVVRNHIAYTPPVLIDCRLKPGFPDELFCDGETARTVDERWREYFPGGLP